MRDLRVDARTVGSGDFADLIIALRSRADDPKLRRAAEASDAELQVLKRNSGSEIRRLLLNYFNVVSGVDDMEVQEAVKEAEEAIEKVLADGVAVALAPRRPVLRKMQHRLAARYHLVAESSGKEPQRHLVIHPH